MFRKTENSDEDEDEDDDNDEVEDNTYCCFCL